MTRLLSCVVFLALSLLLTSCAPSNLTVDSAQGTTLNYRFELNKRSNEETGQCYDVRVRVRPMAKMYRKEQPPSRMRLYDMDCEKPTQFERIYYVDDDGDPTYLNQDQIPYFWSDHQRLHHELRSWMFSEGY